MGPGCFHPRNVAGVAPRTEQIKLQWGRDVSIPEIGGVTVLSRQTAGFNGAGMFPSQKCQPLTVAAAAAMALQWGLDVSIPEMWTAQVYLPAFGRFNGAGMFPSQK